MELLFDRVAKLVRSQERFLLTTHPIPDGDCLGSEMALHFYLKKIGKQSQVINAGPTPEKFALLDPHREIHVFNPSMALPKADLIFVVDTNDLRMLNDMESSLRGSNAPIIFVDHHVPETDDVEEHLIDERYAATGELVYDFLRHLRADIDSEIALSLYVAILTDTGGFRYKRTSPKSHLIAAELLQKGICPEKIFQSIYARNSIGKVRLFGHILEGISTRCGGRIGWVTVHREARERYQATIEDTESFIGQLTLIEGLDIAIMFREEPDGRIKVSLRGMGEVPVIGIARKFGGGGHRHAAGMKIPLSLDEVVEKVLSEAEAVLKAHPPE